MGILTAIGVVYLSFFAEPFISDALAQSGVPFYRNLRVDSGPIDAVINIIFTYLEGSFGALIMVIAGIFAIVSAAFGQYKAALGLLVVAVGAYVLRSLVGTFFNDAGIA